MNREVIVMFRPNAVQLHQGQIEAALADLEKVDSILKNVLVGFDVQRIRKGHPSFQARDTLRISAEGREVRSMDLTNIFALALPVWRNRDSLIARLKELSSVVFAGRNGVPKVRLMPNDLSFSRQWGLNNTGQSGGAVGADIHAEAAWDITTGNPNTRIGIVDNGRVQETHPDFSNRVSGDLTSPVSDHATHVAGVAAATGGNSTGIAGVDWQTRIDTRTLGPDQSSTAQVIRNAVDAGDLVLNHSWGHPNYEIDINDAFAYAYKSNRVSAVAMPEPSGDWDYPNTYGQGIINVGATNNLDAKASYSNPNAKAYISVAAPGGEGSTGGTEPTQIYSTLPTSSGSYGYKYGTSSAAPVVTGIASLLKGYSSTLYNDDIIRLIELSAEKVRPDLYTYDQNGWNINVGYGRVNARKALDLLGPQYVFEQRSAGPGGTDMGATDLYEMAIFDVSGLPQGAYFVKRHEIRRNVSFSAAIQPFVWGRGVASIGWNVSNAGYNFATPYCDIVPGTVTSTGATLRTYVYEVFSRSDGHFIGLYPTDANGVSYAYSILRRNPIVSVPGAYPTLQAALSDVVSGQTILLSSGSYEVSSNTVVPSGITLALNPGASLYVDGGTVFTMQPGSAMAFSASSRMVVHGSLTTNGTAASPVTFTSRSSPQNPGDWDGVYLYGGPNQISYTNISFATWGIIDETSASTQISNSVIFGCLNYGIYAQDNGMSSASLQMQACDIRSNAVGIGLNNSRADLSNGTTVTYSTNSTYGGIYLYNSVVYLSSSGLHHNTGPGIYSDGLASYVWFTPDGISPGNNDLSFNTDQLKVKAGGAFLGERVTYSEYICPGDEYSISLGSFEPLQVAPPGGCYWQTTTSDHGGYNHVYLRQFPWSYYINNNTATAVKAQLTYWDACPPDQARFNGPVDPSNCFTEPANQPLAPLMVAGRDGEETERLFAPSTSVSSPMGLSRQRMLNWIKYLRGRVEGDSGNAVDCLRQLAGFVGAGGRFQGALGIAWETFLQGVASRTGLPYLREVSLAYRLRENVANHDFSGAMTLANTIPLSDGSDDLWMYCQSGKLTSYLANGDTVGAIATYNYMRARALAIDPEGLDFLLQGIRIHERALLTGRTTDIPIEANSEQGINHAPISFRVWQNFPNPFNPSTQISFVLPANTYVTLAIFDVLGREVARLIDGFQAEGYMSVDFDASSLPSGVYFYRLQAGKFVGVKKMVLAK